MRIGKLRSVREVHHRPIRGRGNRQNAIRRTFRRTIPDHKEVVVVIHQFIRRRKPLPQRLSQGTNQCLVLGLEFFDKTVERFSASDGADFFTGVIGSVLNTAPLATKTTRNDYTARELFGTVWDPVRRQFLVFGGTVFETNVMFNDTWRLSAN
jgi:hypothetical protein